MALEFNKTGFKMEPAVRALISVDELKTAEHVLVSPLTEITLKIVYFFSQRVKRCMLLANATAASVSTKCDIDGMGMSVSTDWLEENYPPDFMNMNKTE